MESASLGKFLKEHAPQVWTQLGAQSIQDLKIIEVSYRMDGCMYG